MKKRLKLKRHWRILLKVIMIIIILFSVDKTASRYKTNAHISIEPAVPVLSIDPGVINKELEFIDFGWATQAFDIVNGKLGSDGLFYVNEIDMEYYINIVQDGGDLPLNLINLYFLNDDGTLGDDVPYVEGKGYGPVDLPYKQDDETVLNPAGYYESKYITRVHFMIVYTYGNCGVGVQNCIGDANDAGKEYKFHVEAKAYQKVS